MMFQEKTYTALFGAVVFWCLLLVIPPVAAAGFHTDVAFFFYKFFSKICHQDEMRSLHVLGHTLAVCARCSMIYAGFMIGMFVTGVSTVRPLKNFSLWFALVLLPMVLDVGLDVLGVHQTTMVSRVLTGLAFGVGSGILLTPLLVESIHRLIQVLRNSDDAKA